MPPRTLEDCYICEALARRDPTLPVYPAVHTCALCNQAACPLHTTAMRLLPGLRCTICLAVTLCGVCGKRARNRCTHCGSRLCRLHTQELCGQVACGRCAR